MKYKVGDKVVNGGGVRTTVIHACLNCKTLVPEKAPHGYKCCVRNSCPGWTQLPRRERRIKTQKVFTLSSFNCEKHTIDGKPPKHPSLAESMGPLHEMVKFFKSLPTGTRIKVTMENVRNKTRV